VIAVLSTGSFANNEDFLEALFGQSAVVFADQGGADWQSQWTRLDNGLFSPTRNRRVSGVITATQLAPWSVQTHSPRLWTNPWAERPLALTLDWLAATIINEQVNGDGELEFETAATAPETFFDLTPDWPGPEKPFE
jgi:hypothetical protein